MVNGPSTTSAIRLENPTGFQLLFQSKGRLGNLQTLEHAKDLIRFSVMFDRGLKDFVTGGIDPRTGEKYGILYPEDLTSHSPRQEVIEAVHAWVVTNIRYISDLAGGIESLQDARETLKRGAGDCDDLTILECSMLGTIGIETAIVAAKYKPGTTGFDHMFLAAMARGAGTDALRIYLDPTISTRPAGFFKEGALSLYIDPIFTPGWQQQTVSGRAFLRSTGRTAAKATDVVASLAKPFIGFLHPVLAGLNIFGAVAESLSELSNEANSSQTSSTKPLEERDAKGKPVLNGPNLNAVFPLACSFLAGAGVTYLTMKRKKRGGG